MTRLSLSPTRTLEPFDDSDGPSTRPATPVHDVRSSLYFDFQCISPKLVVSPDITCLGAKDEIRDDASNSGLRTPIEEDDEEDDMEEVEIPPYTLSTDIHSASNGKGVSGVYHELGSSSPAPFECSPIKETLQIPIPGYEKYNPLLGMTGNDKGDLPPFQSQDLPQSDHMFKEPYPEYMSSDAISGSQYSNAGSVKDDDEGEQGEDDDEGPSGRLTPVEGDSDHNSDTLTSPTSSLLSQPAQSSQKDCKTLAQVSGWEKRE